VGNQEDHDTDFPAPIVFKLTMKYASLVDNGISWLATSGDSAWIFQGALIRGWVSPYLFNQSFAHMMTTSRKRRKKLLI
jgi:hypothetical protein